MVITHDHDKHMFVAVNDVGKRMGTLEYAPRDEKTVVATHTIVDNAYRGGGVGGALLSAMAAWAEGNALKIVPECGFVASSFMRERSRYAPVIAEE